MTEQSVETVMLRAVNLALDEIGEYWCSAVSWEPKGVDDRVTFLDKQIEKKLQSFLQEYSNYGFMGEEYGVKSRGERLWVLDPIDGTVNFTVRLPMVAVSLALMEGDKAVLGAVGEAVSKRIYWSDGKHLFLDNAVVSNSRKVSTLEEAFVGLGTPRKDDPFAAGYGKFLSAVQKKAMRLRMLGSAALGLTYVASGALDAFLLPRFELWDVAAGRLLVEVSGGSYWQEGPNSILIAARNEALLEDLKQIWYGVNSL
ncbi:MAG TPA: inositol monophosphatase family protein [Coprothermobacter proteolyticus]|nr:inositol monophosphatase family protein [Coprothermobacter proteolyticus]HPZ44902.1 inositol monophosphatase family protein [Coprothermobacter proteolyticus]HQD07167.1 inositol monophosphatase family protein [Coprothermobacter proteolyticus]